MVTDLSPWLAGGGGRLPAAMACDPFPREPPVYGPNVGNPGRRQNGSCEAGEARSVGRHLPVPLTRNCRQQGCAKQKPGDLPPPPSDCCLTNRPAQQGEGDNFRQSPENYDRWVFKYHMNPQPPFCQFLVPLVFSSAVLRLKIAT